MLLNSGGWWLSGPGFGDSKDEEGYSLAITPSHKVAYVGYSTSYGQGSEDVYLVIVKKDSIVMNYTLSKIEFNDTTCSPLAVQENNIESTVCLYPNPFSGSSVLEINKNKMENDMTFMLYDVTGREVQKIKIKNEKTEINKGNSNEGIYFYTISSPKEMISQGKLVIQ
jgi:hypothetical protein